MALLRVQPWRAATFTFSTDPELVAKVTDVIGLYLAPPENAIVLWVDETSQIQALDRTQKMLPMPTQINSKSGKLLTLVHSIRIPPSLSTRF